MEDINSNINADLEVRKLQDLVKKLERQNEQLRTRSTQLTSSGGVSGSSRPTSSGPQLFQSAAGLAGFHGVGFRGTRGFGAFENARCMSHNLSVDDTDYLGSASVGGLVAAGSLFEGAGDVGEGERTILDEVEILSLEDTDCLGEEDSWLYQSPKKNPTSLRKAVSPLAWCRQVLDHPSPDVESAKRSLIHRLEQTMSEKLRRSLPNLSKTSGVQAAEPVKNSRSCDSNIQVPNGGVPRLQQQPSAIPSPSKLRPPAAPSPLSLRQPIKAMLNPGTSSPTPAGAPTTPTRSIGSRSGLPRPSNSSGGGIPVPRSKLAQPVRR
ncbi:UNVERIFIED_CONTAM: hypothetical protein FKN15_039729 [Acipenser sinensis]